MALLFEPLTIRGLTLRNRIVVSPMCEYSSKDGFATNWHLVHLGSRAVGGAGLVLTEAAAVSPEGRISPSDLGIWQDAHVAKLAEIVTFIHAQGAASGIQIAHAGRKASTAVPWEGGARVAPEAGGWQPVAPSPLAFDPAHPVPHALSVQEIAAVMSDFAAAAKRAVAAGFDVIELHAAHGYLLHEFFSPLSNARTDAYGGSFENRTRIAREVVHAVRVVIPETMPLFVRISATDWVPGGWDIGESVLLARDLQKLGVDLIDASSGALVPYAVVPAAPGFQVPFAERIRSEAAIATGAVGLITEPEQAEAILQAQQADVVLLARELLRDPYWPLHAADALGVDLTWPAQYRRAKRQLVAR